MKQSKPRRIAAVIAIAAAVTAVFVWRYFFRPPPPLEVSFWYWRQPFQVQPDELQLLHNMGVKRLFVRAGTFHLDQNDLRLTLVQRWASRANGIDVHLVFNFDSSVLRRFAETPNSTIASAILKQFSAARTAAESAGLHVAGLQLDLDCPTSKLTKYGELLHRVRQGLTRPSIQLSVTALPTWYHSPLLGSVVSEVDFAAPQYYEARIGSELSGYTTVSMPANAEIGLRDAGWRGSPFFAGIPIYGHAIVYNPLGQLVGAYHDMGVCEAVRNPAFQLERSFAADSHGHQAAPQSYIGEDVYDLRSLVEAGGGHGTGYHILYDVPTPKSLAIHLDLLKRKRPGNCLGMILFRYPEQGDGSTLSLRTVASVLAGKVPAPELKVKIRIRPAVWELLDSGDTPEARPIDVEIEATNVGDSNTFIAPDAAELVLAIHNAGIDSIALRGADSCETFSNASEIPSVDRPAMRSSTSRANVVRLRRLCLATGETKLLAILRVRARSGAVLKGNWTLRLPGGFQRTSGAVAETKITN